MFQVYLEAIIEVLLTMDPSSITIVPKCNCEDIELKDTGTEYQVSPIDDHLTYGEAMMMMA